MSRLSVSVLGPPHIHHDTHLLTFSTRKTQALLLYLAVEGGEHSRKKLSELFWPEQDAAHGRAMLRHVILQLRNLLRETEENASPHLLTERDTLYLDFTSHLEIDLQRLHGAWRHIRTEKFLTTSLSNATGRHDLLTLLTQATQLVRGPFLAGFSLRDAPAFDDWQRYQHDLWQQRVHLVFAWLTQVQTEGGEHEQAIETVTRWLAFDPLYEAAYQQSIQLYLTLGDRAAALRAFETCRTVLHTELQVEPSAETIALAQRIRTTASPPRRTYSFSSSLQPPTTLVEGPLVGRTTEFGTLITCYQMATQGQAQVVLVEGEAGIGKTRLATEFLQWAQAHGADGLWGRSFEVEGRLPYQPLLDALRPRLERENAPEDLLPDIWLTELSRLFPELRERYPDLPISRAEEHETRLRVFEAVARLLHGWARRCPVVFVLDDVQWTDSASLDLLLYVTGSWVQQRLPLLLLLCLRSEERNAVTRWMGAMSRLAPLRHLLLNPLTREQTIDLLSALQEPASKGEANRKSTADASLQQMGQWLYTETRGQPFYLLETLKGLLDRRIVLPHLGENGMWSLDFTSIIREPSLLRAEVPSSVQELIETRLDRLSLSALALLRAGAVLSEHLTFERLARTARLDEENALLALDEVVRQRLLHRRETQAEYLPQSIYPFVHDTIREVVYRQTSEARRRVLHRRALEVLQTLSASSAELAHHALRAGLVEPTLRYSVAAGDEAMAVFAVQDAIVHFEHARRLLLEHFQTAHEFPFPHALVEHLYLHLARAYQLAQQWQQAREVYLELLQAARQEHQVRLECALLNHLAMLLVQYEYDVSAALQLLETARQVAEASDDLLGQIEAEANFAELIGRDQEKPQSAFSTAEHAVALARRVEQPHLLAYSLSALTDVVAHDGYWQDAILYGTEAYTLFQQLGTLPLERLDTLSTPIMFTGVSPSVELNTQALAINCQMNVVLGMTFCGMDNALQKVLPLAQQNYEDALRLKNDVVVLSALFALLVVNLEMDSYEEVLSLASSAVALANSVGTPHMRFWFLYLEGQARQRLFHLEAAQRVYVEMRRLAQEKLNEQYTEIAVACQIATAAMQGNWTEAQRLAHQATQVRLSRQAFRRFSDLVRYYEVEALLRAGEETLAQESMEDLSKRVETNSRYRIPLLRSQALVAQWSGKTNKALAPLEEAAHLAEEIGLRGELWQIQAVLGELWQSMEKQERAQQVFAQAALVVQEFAGKMEDEVLRISFLTAPQVQRVLERARRDEKTKVQQNGV